MYVSVSSKRKDAMRKYFLLLTLCGLSTSVYGMGRRMSQREKREDDFLKDLQRVASIENLEQQELSEDSFLILRQLQGDYDPVRQKLFCAMWHKTKKNENKLQEMENKLRQSEETYVELRTKLEQVSEMDKLCEVIQKLGDARRTLYDRLMYGAGGVIMGLFLAYSVSKR